MKEKIAYPVLEDAMEEYKEEWLLFEVLEIDEKNQPQKVRLVWHSKNKEEVCSEAKIHNIKRGVLVYAGEVVPKDAHVVL